MTTQASSTLQPSKPVYTIVNEKQYPQLQEIKNLRQEKQLMTSKPNYRQMIQQSFPFVYKWTNLRQFKYVCMEIDEQNKTIKLHEKFQWIPHQQKLTQQKFMFQVLLTSLLNKKQYMDLIAQKNFINGNIKTKFTYNWFKFNKLYVQKQFDHVLTLGAQLNYNKWLSQTLKTNQKKLSFKWQVFDNPPNDLDQKFSAEVFLANRDNYHESKNKQHLLSQNVVKPSSDFLGCKLDFRQSGLGLKETVSCGFDYFHRSYFGKFKVAFSTLFVGNNFNFEVKVNTGAIMGKNLMENDLLARTKRRWVNDRSVKFFNTRLTCFVKNFHPAFGKAYDMLPYFYLQGCASQNLTQIKTKYELDYGIGLKISDFSIDTSLIRIGKNLDDINPSIRINF